MNNDRNESCRLALEGIDDADLAVVLSFSDRWDRLAKLRDKINATLLQELEKAKRRVQEERAARGS